MNSIQNMNVLVVDDDEIILDVTEAGLQECGINHVEKMDSGRKALMYLDSPSHEIDLILLDLNMPEMDGVEFLRHLASRHFEKDIVVFSAEDKRLLGIAINLAKEHHLNVLGSIEKPFQKEMFMEILKYKKNLKPKMIPKSKKYDLTPEDLRVAILNDEIIMYFQPQIDVHSKKVVGFESLVRWNHPAYGIIPPDEFIPLAEEGDLIGELTERTVDLSIEQAKFWKKVGHPIKTSINLSAKLLDRLDLPEIIEGKVKAAELKTADFVIEITESQLMENLAVALEIITRLSLKRFELSIDDFGTGYSSMKQLQQIPFTELKIDKMFVNDVDHNPEAKAILESSVALAKKLHIKTVAEGVETQEDWDAVDKSGCDIVQGYFVSRPIPGEEAVDWVKQWEK